MNWLTDGLILSQRQIQTARVVELADTPDLGSGSVRIRGSSPLARTTLDFCYESTVMLSGMGENCAIEWLLKQVIQTEKIKMERAKGFEPSTFTLAT